MTSGPGDASAPRRRPWLRAAAAAGIAGVLAGLWFGLPWIQSLARSFTPGAIQEMLDASGALAPLLFMALMAAAVIVPPLPSLPLDIAAGLTFGPVAGTAYAVAGAGIGAAIDFWLARLAGRALVERLVGGHVVFCRHCSDRLLTWVILVSRMLPFVAFDVVSYGAGLTGISIVRFLLATIVGMLPLTALYVSAGAVFRIDPAFAIPLGAALVVAMLLLPRWIERRNPFGMARLFRHEEER